MLRLYPSNKTEHLALVIAEIMKGKPLSAPFENEVILIQSHGMGTWLQQEVSQNLGIAAMIDCKMPASFIWQLSQLLMPEDPHIPIFEKNNLRWQILEILPEKLKDPRYINLASYVNALSQKTQIEPSIQGSDNIQNSEQLLFELSDVLADLFDAYQNYRPDWISAWEKGENINKSLGGSIETNSSNDAGFLSLEVWQADLWRSLYPDASIETRNHRAILLQKLLARLKDCPKDLQAHLPERVFIFGLSALPPQWLPILAALSRYTDVHFMIQNPCQHYWGDVMTETQQLKLEKSLLVKGISAKTAADTFLESNPLLASWGRLGRDYLSILFQHDDIEEMPLNLYEDPSEECTSALTMLQSDILNLQTVNRAVKVEDESIRFISCHSYLREVEALQDYLFKILDTPSLAKDGENKLTPKDIIVMMPDVQDFAALIDAVFSRPAYDQYGQPQYLPYGISDQMLALDQPMVEVLSGILNLSKLRITATEVLDWLDIEAIRERFAISEQDLEQIHAWVTGLNIRWGLSEKHRDECLSTDKTLIGSGIENTWVSAFKRLLAGYIYGVNTPIQDGAGTVFAQSQYSRDAQLLAGKLMRFVDHIEQTLDLQKGKQTIQVWLNRVTDFWASWFDTQYLSDEVQRLMDLAVNSISEQVHYAGFEREISFTIVSDVIAAGFEKERVSQRFLAGRINFCTLMPMRSIPFKVVCMLGMNEGQYPRPEQKVSFDLLSLSDAKVGDRSRREDDRYLFLEAICSARSHLYMSYCGRDIKDNSERYPSLLVSELQDYCARYFYLEGGEHSTINSAEKLMAHWTIEHRLQPFHACYYDTEKPSEKHLPRTYSSDWLLLHHTEQRTEAQQVSESSKPQKQTLAQDIPQFDLFQASSDELRVIELNSLTRMADHPLRYYYRQVLGLSYTELESDFEDSEPFCLSHLDNYYLKVDLANAWGSELVNSELATSELKNKSSSQDVFTQWQLMDRLPRSPVDKFYFENAKDAMADMKASIGNISTYSKVLIDLSMLNSSRVIGELLVAGGATQSLIELSISKNIASRFFGFWVKHVFWNLHCGSVRQQKDEPNLSGASTLITIDKKWTLAALEFKQAQGYANEILAMFSRIDNQAEPFLPKCTFALLFEKETQVKSAFKGVNLGSTVIQGEREDPYWKRYCLFSKEADGAQQEATQGKFDVLPELTNSIFYRQIFESLELICVEELESSELKSPELKVQGAKQ